MGIAGRTGAGKTTLLSLLTRFYDPAAGQILLDGVDLREYKVDDLRDQFAIVLQDPVLFSQATGAVQNYPHEYTYDQFAHVRLARLPLEGLHMRRVLDWVYPGWDEVVDWSLLLERESFFSVVLTVSATLFFLLLRALLAWYADSRLRIPRFHLRKHAVRAGAAFFSAPEIKQ